MTPLVLVPGMMCDARLFGPQIAAMSAGRTIMVADISRAETVQELAATLLAEAPPRFALAGLSMGGIVAMEVLRQAPHRVDRLALLDTNPCAENEVVKVSREPQIEKARAGQMAAVVRDEMKPKYLADGARKAEILELCMQMAVDLGSEAFIRQSRALQSRPDQTELLKGAQLPTLVMCGEFDGLCPIERHKLMHDLVSGSTLEIIPGAGHLITLEQPEAVNSYLTRWLKED